MKTLSYSSIHNLLGRYVSIEAMQLFTDRWERFPDERLAHTIIPMIEKSIITWDKLNPEVSEQLNNAITEIKNRIQ